MSGSYGYREVSKYRYGYGEALCGVGGGGGEEEEGRKQLG